MPYTPQQQQAIETRHVSIALAAGAGCGKTFVLTQRFLAELQRVPRTETLSGMMAITFTDRAAREMRDRIRNEVRQQLQRCSDEELPLWQEILRELESARIQTIHSFCASTLRSHAIELGIDPDFAVLDEPTATSLRNETIRKEFARLLRERDADLYELVLRYGLEQSLASLQRLVGQRFQLSETQQTAPTEEELIALWRRYHGEQFLPRRMQQLAMSENLQRLFSLLRENETTAPKMRERRIILLRLLEELLRNSWLAPEGLRELREHATVTGARPQHWPAEEIHEQVKLSCEVLRKQLDNVLSLCELQDRALEQSAQFGMKALRLTDTITAAYTRAKREQSVLDFDDLLLGLRNLLQADADVRRHLQQSTQFLLVDEFQDTDPVQTQIVETICGERLISGGLFLVGDVKQSIYRFRRADPDVFRALRSRIPEAGRMALTRNFRSQQEILDFVNFLFAPAMADEYDPLEAFDPGPYPPETKVEFLWASDSELADSSVGAKRQVEAEWIAARIVALLHDNIPRIRTRHPETGAVALRPTQPGDIVILFRAFSNLAVYEEALRIAGVEYYVVGGRAFFAQQEIYDLVNLCRFLDDDSDDTALAGVLRSPMFGWSDDTLMLLAAEYGSLTAALQRDCFPTGLAEGQTHAVKAAREILAELMELRFHSGIGPLLRHAVTETAYDAALMTEFLGERKVANLQKLIEMADEFDRNGMLGLSEFADRLLESIDEEAQEELAATHPETGNVVRLMTVHQSKGLEFPVVITADTNRPRRPNTNAAVLSPTLGPLLTLPRLGKEALENPALNMYRFEENLADEQEAIRLFYVATTRAADHLILSAYWTDREKISGPWLKLLDERFDLASGLPRGDAWLGQTQAAGEDWRRIPQIDVITSLPSSVRRQAAVRKLKLSEWPETLANSEPVPPPEQARPLEPDCAGRSRFSVSELEEADEYLAAESTPAASGKPKSSGPGSPLAPRDAEELGNLLHAAMELFDPSSPPDPTDFIGLLCDNWRSHVSENLRQEAGQRFAAILESSVVEELRNASSLFRETEFLLRWESEGIATPAIVSGTIDCLLRDGQGDWHLLDYKSGVLADAPAAILEKYGLQMTVYALAIRQLTGTLPTSIRITQLSSPPRLVELPIDARILDTFRARVDRAINSLRSNSPSQQQET